MINFDDLESARKQNVVRELENGSEIQQVHNSFYETNATFAKPGISNIYNQKFG